MQDERLHPVVAQAVAFTEAYRRHQNEHPARREAACLRAQFPALLPSIAEDEVYAGGNPAHRVVYMGPIWWAMMPCRCGPGKQGGYCFDFAARKRYPSEVDQAALAELEAFWESECTWGKAHRTWDDEIRALFRDDGQVAGGGCGHVVALDFDRLLRLGIPGMRKAIAERQARVPSASDDPVFLEALGDALDVFVSICRHYESEARARLGERGRAWSAGERARLERIASSLGAIVERPPESLHEAIQLYWLYNVIASGRHIEGYRMDEALGDFLARDLDRGVLSEEQATELVLGLWRQFAKHGDAAVCRVVIGGKGRRNPENANRFCRIAMEATRRHQHVIPQLTLRFHAEQEPALLRQAYDIIGEGCTYPMLYNDDVIVPGVAELFSVTEDEAARYHPVACGEYLLGGASPSLLSVGFSIPKSLEAALLGGKGLEGELLGAPTPTVFESFGDLRRALSAQLSFIVNLAARAYSMNNAVHRRECAYLFASLLTDDCLERGRSYLDGGLRYVGACVMAHGFTNAADALIAIEREVFESKSVTLCELIDALRSNFENCEELRARLCAAPKFGNDEDAPDTVLATMFREINDLAKAAARRSELDFLTVSSVNPGGYGMGAVCGATADGRLAKTPFAIGNAPTAGADKRGLTALMNSLRKVSPVNGGATTNIKLSRSLFREDRPKLEALFGTFFKRGGMQSSLTVVNQADLEDALVHPERHSNLLVRVGGWSARFVELEREVQEEIIARTAY